MRLGVKEEEKLVVEEYMEKIYNHPPNFIDTGIDIPDCYFEFNKKYYAVEVTRYFQQNSEQKHIIYTNVVQKYLQEKNFINEVYKRLGKVKQQEEITIAFCDFEELNNLIIDNIKLIKQVNIGNNYFFNEDGLEINNALCFETPKEKMHIKEFMHFAKDDILKEKHINIEILTKNKYSVSINFKFCAKPYWGKDTHKKVIPVFCWAEQEDELYNNIINAIEIKNKKLHDEYCTKLKNNNIPYDYYNLVVYAEGIGAKLKEEKLYEKIKQIKDLQYDEIVIFLWKKIMVINKDGFKILDK